ncbi:unnamed protein product [Onchocerca flexuosa]|uniref:G_PROTEIN_RECEP_F1_2 domain-containing protein n=1 Tax=Onchocerca flexuosa TaxID=387005 RepID=A0A183HA25_9BILA|nr:unnamed protein product [Onchocerca flexuosa]
MKLPEGTKSLFWEGMACTPQFTSYNIFIGLCFTAIFILSLLGNSVIILVIIKLQRRTTRSITNMLLLNLAIADLLRYFKQEGKMLPLVGQVKIKLLSTCSIAIILKL